MANEQKKRYPVASPLKFNGERYAPGDTVELTSAKAKQLQAAGAIYQLSELTVEEIPPAERLAKISEAIGQLDRDNKEHFTAGGKPQVAAIEAIVGFDIKAAERDQAWDAMQGEEK